MSMPTFPERDKIPTRDEAINHMLASIAIGDLALSHVINSGGENIDYAIKNIEGTTIEDLIALNMSLGKTLEGVFLNQTSLGAKLQSMLDALVELEKV